MQKATIDQRNTIANAAALSECVEVWKSFGFTAVEAAAMVKGGTATEATKALGGVWTVGNVPWYQAINAEHAIKLYCWNFGPLNDEDVELIYTDPQGIKRVIDTYKGDQQGSHSG